MIKQSTFLRRVLRLALADGWRLVEVNDGDEMQPTTSSRDVMRVVRSVDVARVHLKKGAVRAWIYCVWQGPDERYPEGEEIVSDYTMNLEPVMVAAYKTVPCDAAR